MCFETSLDENKCHSYFTTFLIRPRSIENNARLLEIENILNLRANVNVLVPISHKNNKNQSMKTNEIEFDDSEIK